MPQKDPVAKREYMRAYLRKTYLRDKDRRWKATEAWRKAHPEVHAATQARYRDKNREKIHATLAVIDKRPHRIAYRKRWREEHPDLVRVMNRKAQLKRKLALAVNGGFCTPAQWHARCVFYGWRCAYCGKQLDRGTVEIDHVIPVAKGGTGWASNLVPACRSCNAKKHDRMQLPSRLVRYLERESLSESG